LKRTHKTLLGEQAGANHEIKAVEIFSKTVIIGVIVLDHSSISKL
jgi:hypothetical protein